MSEHIQAPAIMRVIEEIDSLAGAATENGDKSAALILMAAALNLHMAIELLNRRERLKL